MGHLNSISDPGEGNLTAENKKIQMPGEGGRGGGGMLMLQIDRCIRRKLCPPGAGHLFHEWLLKERLGKLINIFEGNDTDLFHETV